MKPHPSEDPIENQLRRDASRSSPSVPAGMDGRIAHAVARSNQPSRSSFRVLTWTSALGAGTALAAVLVLLLRPAPSLSESAEDRAIAASLAAAVQTMPGQIWSTVQPKAELALQNEPLQKEATALYADARSAVGFLAYNFLPETAAPAGNQP